MAKIVAFIFSTLALTLGQAQNLPQEFLDPQNAARAQVGVRPLIWDPVVAAYAEEYARERKGDCKVIYNSDRPYGENQFWGYHLHWTVGDAVKSWVDQNRFYNYRDNTCKSGESCAQYTQVVWRDSVRVGCAKVECNNGAPGIFIVCNYDPKGNDNGKRPY